jgi:hypothetical protein
MLKKIITCDNCDSDLTKADNHPDWRLALVNQMIEPKSFLTTAPNRCPCVDEDKHFCGLGCLEEWVQIYKNSQA